MLPSAEIMDRPPWMRYLYNRWLFLSIGLAGLGNVSLLVYRFVTLGLVSHPVEHIVAAIFSTVTFLLGMAIFADLTFRKPDKSR